MNVFCINNGKKVVNVGDSVGDWKIYLLLPRTMRRGQIGAAAGAHRISRSHLRRPRALLAYIAFAAPDPPGTSWGA